MLVGLIHAIRAKPLSVLQVGAFDGSTGDRVCPWISKNVIGKGVLLEPQAGPFSKLQDRYRDFPSIILGNWALGEVSGEAEMFRVKQAYVDKHPELLQLTSFDESIFDVYLKRYKIDDPDCLTRVLVKVVTAKDVLEMLGVAELDCLVVDAEGYDARLVNMIIDAGVLPSLICFETCNLRESELIFTMKRLAKLGYLLESDSIDLLCYRGGLSL
jgi:FkbM family methyltransferase